MQGHLAQHQFLGAGNFRSRDAALDYNLDSLGAGLHGPLCRLTHGPAVGGEFNGTAELDVRAGGPFVSLQGTVYDVDMEGLLNAFSDEPAGTSGTGNFNVELTGIGDNLDEVLSTATGSIEFALRDGAQQGVDLEHELCDHYNRKHEFPRPEPASVDATRFSLVRGSAQVRDGIASTSDILANLTAIEVSGGGRVDLVTHGIDLELDVEMTAPIPISGCETLDGEVGETIPVVVSGSISDPQRLPDFEELIRRQAEEAILDAVRDLLN